MRPTFAAFSLVEITLALAVAAFCLIAIFGLLPVALNSNQASLEQTAAASVASSVAADLYGAPSGANSVSPRFGFAIPSTANAGPLTIYLCENGLPSSGKMVGDGPAAGESRYRVSLAFVPPATGQRNATTVRVLVTWSVPPNDDPAAWPVKFSGSFETVTALDRN